MAWSRNVGESFIPGSTIYSFTEVDWYVDAAKCTYRHLGGVTSPFYWDGTAYGQPTYWKDNDWHNYKQAGSDHFGGYGDLKLFDFWDEWARGQYDYVIGLGCTASFGSYSGGSYLSYTVPHYAGNISSLTASRVSDNQVNLSWTNPSTSIDGVEVQVSINGAAWATVTTLGAASSYQYTQASADHTYKFRVRASYISSWGGFAESSTITMAPTPPAAISVAATSGTNVTVTLDNPSEVATSTSYQLSADGQTWASSEVTGQSTTSFSVNMGANHYIRVKNVNATGSSAWIVSGYIQTVTKPNPPSISASMQTWDIASNLTVSWIGSYPDGSSQTAYKYRTRKNGGAWSETTVNPSTATSLTLTPAGAGVAVGDTFSISVATKGAAADYSDYPAELVIQVAQKPTVYVTSPAGSPQATIQTMPIEVRATFSDTGNTCEAATCTLKQGTAELYSEAMTISSNALSCDISEFLPDNNAAYSLEVYAISSTGLSQTAVVPFVTDFLEPVEGSLSIVNDPETGYASLTASFDNTDADEPAESISVTRINLDGTRTTLISNAPSGSGIVDRFAPLNNGYKYAVTTTASTKAVKVVYFENEIKTPRWFAYWGDRVAWARWNPKGGTTITRPEKKRVHYVGRTYPVSYDSLAIDQQNTLKVTALLDEWSDGFADLMRDGGRGVYKGADGSVFWADFEYSTSADYASATRIDEVSLTITRIDGEKL